MKSTIKKIAIIGSGVIGSGWAIRLLAYNKIVNIYDPKKTQQIFLKSEIKRIPQSVLTFYKIILYLRFCK